MKSCLLAFDCSSHSAGLALLDLEQLRLIKHEIKTDRCEPAELKSKQKEKTELKLEESKSDLLQELNIQSFDSNSKNLKDKLKKRKRQNGEPIRIHLKTENLKKEIISNLSIKPFGIEWSDIKTIPGFIERTWDSSSGSHSDQLPLKIREVFEESLLFRKNSTNQRNQQISFNLISGLIGLAVGIGPGRFTGIRTALSVAKSLAYSLKVPICPINSLQMIAESFFEDKRSQDFSKVYVSLQAFKNQVYHGEFYRCSDSKSFFSISKEKNSPTALSLKENLSLLDFKDWEEKIISSPEENLLCLSDLKSFYQINPQALKKLHIQKPKISPWILVKLALKQGNWIQDWKKIQPNYMRRKI